MAPFDPPPNASDTYKTLHATALEFIRAQEQDVSFPTRMNQSRLKAICSSTSYRHSFGHNYLTSTQAVPAGAFDVDGFIAHLNRMIPSLESWDTDITDVIVDEVRRKVVLRASYWMKVKGETVENDLVWFLTMEEDGKRISKSVEFIDGVASGRLGEIIKGAKT